MTRKDRERGSGTVLALGIIALLVVLLTVAVGLIGVVTANQKAARAADLAALAAADSARGLRPGNPCELAAEVARANRAQLVNCNQPANLEGTVDVRTSSEITGPFFFLGPAESLSRAGPPR